MKSQSAVEGAHHHPRTRAERRALEREARHEQSRRDKQPAIRIPTGSLVGGALTILVVLGALIYGITRSNGSTATPNGLTDPKALNPTSSLLAVGQKAPNFTLRDAFGEKYALAAQRGHPVVLEFFATWCPVCHGEAPIMAKLTKNYMPRGVQVWSVLANPYGKNYEDSGGSDLRLATRADLAWYARTYNVQHPQLIDPSFATVNRYGISAYPGLYVINGKGVVTFAAAGHQSYAKLVGVLDRAMGHGAWGGR